MRYPDYIEANYEFPNFYRVQTHYPRPRILKLEDIIKKRVKQMMDSKVMSNGETVCIAVGSRGIQNIEVIVPNLVQTLKKQGLTPFIIPAMGSHGGGTALGQKKVLEALGITEKICGCEIRSSLEVTKVGTAFSRVPVYFSKDAIEADHCICINRIKPHTKFKGEIESGIYKMLTVGIGKHQGALAFHKWALKYGFFSLLKKMGDVVIQKTNFRFALGIVENAYDETMAIEVLEADSVYKKEKDLLVLAKNNMPQLPAKKVDVLIVQQFGKDISGSGLDPNITGRAYDLMEDDFSEMFYTKRLGLLSLSKKTKGNGLGIGTADFITERIFKELDYESTVMNVMTSISIRKGGIPIYLPNDQKVIQACFTTIGPIGAKKVRAIVIKDTLNITECFVSEALLDEVKDTPRIKVLEKTNLSFDTNGTLLNTFF